MNSSEQRKDFSIIWTEQDRLDAARLLAVLEQRSEKRKALAGSARLGPAEIAEPSVSPLGKGADGEKSALGSGTLDPRRQQSTVAGGECDGLGSWLGLCVCDASMRQPAPCAGPNESGFTVEAQFEEEAWNVRDGND